MPALHPAQLQICRESRRFNVAACGRRFGKTVLGEDRLIGPAARGGRVAWFAPTYKMLSEVWRDVNRLVGPLISERNAQEMRLGLRTGGSIDFWSLDNPDVARGRKYRRVVVDEAAMIPKLGEAWQAVIRPTLADEAGDAWILSTPKGRNFFAAAFALGADPHETEWASWQLPTATNPYIPTSEIAAMRRSLPERIYQQEIEARFLDDAGGVFRRVIDAATAMEQHEAQPGHDYLIGVDWGKLADYTAMAVLDVTTNELVQLDRSNQVDYQVQLSRLQSLCRRFNTRMVVPERNSMGEPLIEQLHRDGYQVVPFVTTAASKQAAIDALALAFEQGTLRIIPDPVLIDELQAYEGTRMPSGMIRYGAPEGMHDDTVMALAFAWSGVTGAPGPGVWL